MPSALDVLKLSHIRKTTGLSMPTLRREISAGRLRAHRLGHLIVVFPENYDTWLKARPVSAVRADASAARAEADSARDRGGEDQLPR